MDQRSPYRRSYEKKSLSDAYHRFVDGEMSLGDLVKLAKLSKRTLMRYSSRDEWVTERDDRKAEVAKFASALAAEAAMAPDDATDGTAVSPEEMVAGGDLKAVILRVLKGQQRFWDRIQVRAEALFAAAEEELGKPGTRVMTAATQLSKVLEVAERASTNVRRAYGIPDVTRLEFEDKTPAAQRHADKIRQRKAQRDAASVAASTPASPLPN